MDFLHALIVTCTSAVSLEQGLIVGLFVAGVVGGFTHCAPMCGAFVVHQSLRLEKVSQAFLIPYHLGRTTTYVLLAMALTVFFDFTIIEPLKVFVIVPLLTFAALLFFLSVVPETKVNLLQVFRGVSPYVGRLFSRVSGLSMPLIFKQYLSGMVLGLMPCGLSLSAVLAASTAPLPTAFIGMGLFGLGTSVALICVAFGGRFFGASNVLVRRGAAVVSGLWLLGVIHFL